MAILCENPSGFGAFVTLCMYLVGITHMLMYCQDFEIGGAHNNMLFT